MSSKSTLSIIIPTKNRPQQLRRLIESMERQKIAEYSFEILVIDDSENLSAQTLRTEFPSLRVKYHSSEAKGANSARNLGLQCSEADYLYFLDDDTWLTKPDHLIQIVQNLSE